MKGDSSIFYKLSSQRKRPLFISFFKDIPLVVMVTSKMSAPEFLLIQMMRMKGHSIVLYGRGMREGERGNWEGGGEKECF